MRCRVCGREISIVMMDGRQTAVHTEVIGSGAGFDVVTPSAGQQRKLRRPLEQQCRQSFSETSTPATEPGFVDDVRSVKEATPEGFRTVNV